MENDNRGAKLRVQMTESAENPSEFWEDLAQQHRTELDQYGMDQIKRHQAFYYFNWPWTWASRRQNPQLEFLLRNSSPSTIAWCAATKPQLRNAAWDGTTLGYRDRLLYTFAVRLLWEYARKHGEASILGLKEPLQGDPLPIFWRGRLISQDLANCALEARAILGGLDGKTPRTIVEVGAGYGRTAYSLLHLFPEATYTIVDIEPALSISKWYLSQLFPAERLRFFSPGEAQNIPPSSSDLVISISSLQEMTRDQVAQYLQVFDRIAAGGTVFLKQWREWFNPADNLQMKFYEYPFPSTWRARLMEASPVQTGFMQAAWSVPASPSRVSE
jgi:putative sugar O-methyltransferase